MEAWEADFAALAEQLPPVPPRPAVWTQLQRRMAAVPSGPSARAMPSVGSRPLRVWRGVAAAGWALAAALLLAIGLRSSPEVQPAPSRPVLVSSLLPRQGGPLYVVTFDPERDRLVVVAAAPPQQPGHVARLWLVPDENRDPIALAPIRTDRTQSVALTSDQTRLVTERAGLVITLEPEGSLSSETAQGPVVAHGVLARW